ncbi:hypothetical protein [Leptothoe sp. PORK10 BA2]|uniref:hypothetical protein n=1 Tax=Leptothoe sp. PORK10 BA2 TaxID=3110254 RepID=UPI002B20A59C|nr:hypothetical protein [Leptothoe sp. PORK10 BA2]MEA5465355.1 hypothetical protein [Leptothoe sp. PORK10 BA2]
MTAPTSESENTRAVLRSQEPESQFELPWNREGEFEIEALIVSQSKSDLLVKVQTDHGENHLTISGFLPGRVSGQRWRLECVRSSGSIELLDGEPLE